MNDRHHRHNGSNDDSSGDDAAVERLLRAAGRRPEVPAERTERVREAVRLQWQQAIRSRRRLRWLIWATVPSAAAAAGLLLLGPDLIRWFARPSAPDAAVATLERSTGDLVWSGGPSPMPGEQLAAGLTLRTFADGRAAVRLRHGISIRIDGESTVRFDGTDSIRLDGGRLYLDTAGASTAYAGVAIATSIGVVRDIGTRFQVALEAGRLQVSVRDGVAQIEHGGRLHEAGAGVRVDIDDGGRMARSAVSPHGPEWDWVLSIAPEFDLEGALLGRYLDWIGRETGLRIEFSEPSIAGEASSVILHGSVAGLRPDETLDVVLPTCGLRHRDAGGALIIERDPAAAQ